MMKLVEQIEDSRKEIKTDSYPMSIGEITNLYRDGDLVIFPEYQRYFRWTRKQKSEFIESLILDIPIPPIFVSNNADGRWDIIDGLQRTSTILEFMGLLRKRDNDAEFYEPSVLLGTKFLPNLEGKKWDDEDDLANSLPAEVRRNIKRRKINISIVDSTVNPNIKYELFQRLNRNGSILKGQEVRNSLMIMINNRFYKFIEKLSSYERFIEIIDISDKKKDEQFQKELIVRFLILLETEGENINPQDDMESYLTEEIINISETFNNERYTEIEEKFDQTCNLLQEVFGEGTFKKYYKSNNKFKGQFFLGLFEAIFVPVYINYDFYKDNQEDLKEKVKGISDNSDFKASTKHGIRALDRMKKVFELGKETFYEHR
ncbi:DUF262 domain-containing protein [Listeria monocytogenes]|uniref:DUF262 domain-containing protein n=2 Tax=Listeria TaxID=1637 RepID=UPI000A99DFF1|nr:MULTISPECIES: DUF262 domain-containing protein [Listeria]EHT7468630.1 DUF262 domain-containing protein [Listeria monocytogenes]EIQ6262428.1 DUF262 domain-containing protein [Listeria monocytogenes]EIQ6316528.1 DUF262 domain-containing protein [Listeria monocytogenes]ELD8291280.1 DUF262 domain-containing protein [Listeria innocua]ELD8325841.1 DUF262 domain-containing protein [Listeria innocua]